MSTILKDGRGTGNTMEVDDHGRAYVKANMVSHMSHHATFHKNAYQVTYETTLAGSSSSAIALLYNSSQSKDTEIYKIVISSNADIETNLYVNEKYISDGNLVSPVNTNLSTTVLPTSDTYEGGASGDLVLDTSSSLKINGEYIGAYTPYNIDYEGAIVLTPKTGLSVYAKGVFGDKIKVTISFALHDEGTKL